MGRKKPPVPLRTVNFRLPEDRYDLLLRYAEINGTDLSSVLNRLVAEVLPHIRNEVRFHLDQVPAIMNIAPEELQRAAPSLSPRLIPQIYPIMLSIAKHSRTPAQLDEWMQWLHSHITVDQMRDAIAAVEVLRPNDSRTPLSDEDSKRVKAMIMSKEEAENLKRLISNYVTFEDTEEGDAKP